MKSSEPFVSRPSCAIVAVVFVTGLLQLGMRLKEVQVDAAADFNYASSQQSVRRVQTAGVRGRIVDRNGVILADNRPSVSIVCHPSSFQRKSWSGTVEEISKAIAAVSDKIGCECKVTEGMIKRHVRQSLAMPLCAWRDIGDRELAVFSEHEAEFPGFSIAETEERMYPNGELAAHVLGYVGRDAATVEAGDEKFNFVTPEMCGRAGLESYYDGFLRGVPGEKKLLVDARGFAIREWTVAEGSRGPDLKLSIDIRIQREAERQLAGLCGACVALDPRNGEVLAFASAPGFDPNTFVPVLAQETYDALVRQPGKPLLNRASGGAYAPGSTFKPITALAGLSAGWPADAEYSCCGVFFMGTMHLRCASRWGHGEVDMCRALMKSCNPYFCNLGMNAGTNAIIRTARQLGLGSKTGLDFGTDRAGTVPDNEWKKKRYGEKWYPGDTAQMSIGQGMLLVSPLQMARVAGAIGTGALVTPHLKLDVQAERQALAIPKWQLDIVRKGMRMVVAGTGDERGTGWRGGDGVGVSVSGKTGTAEVGSGSNRRKNTWFIAFAPSESPRVAVAMVIENGESGGSTTAPRVGEVLKAIFDGQEERP